jgi:hypothetical protein
MVRVAASRSETERRQTALLGQARAFSHPDRFAFAGFGFRMGSIFPLIADDALQAEDADYFSECQVCLTPRVAVYPCQGYLARPDGTADEPRIPALRVKLA